MCLHYQSGDATLVERKKDILEANLQKAASHGKSPSTSMLCANTSSYMDYSLLGLEGGQNDRRYSSFKAIKSTQRL